MEKGNCGKEIRGSGYKELEKPPQGPQNEMAQDNLMKRV